MTLWRRKRKGKVLFCYVAVILLLLFVIPCSLYLFCGEVQEVSIEGDRLKVRLLVHEKNEVKELGLEEYVAGVVAAEMPAAFPLEALKAQAVAARTYAVKRLQVPDPRIKSINLRADLTSDHTVNQAWISSEEMRRRWGPVNYPLYLKKITQAVLETRGQVLIYGGQLIDPAYHASCGGCGTENSEDVWKYSVPYLRRVECNNHPAGNKEAVNVVKLSELNNALGTGLPILPAGTIQKNSGIIATAERTASGRVRTFTLGSKTISGSELRMKLGLPSTQLQWQVEKDVVKFSSRGYGHGVGMCQYGAAALAKEGKNHRDILAHYYQGTLLAGIKYEARRP